MSTDQNIPELLKRSRLSDSQIAVKAGVDRSTVNRWRTGTVPNSPEHVVALARALGVNPSWVRPDWAEVFK